MESATPRKIVSIWWVFGPALALIGLGFAAVLVVLTSMNTLSVDDPRISWIGSLIVASAVLMLGGLWLLAKGAYRDGEVLALAMSSDSVAQATRELGQVQAALRDLTVTPTQTVVQVTETASSAASSTEERLAEERSRRQDAERGLLEWQDRTVEVLRSIELLACNEDLDEGYRNAAERVANDFQKKLGAVGFSLVRPQPGDAYDDLLHDAVEIVEDDAMAGKVIECRTWGVMLGSRRECAQVVVGKTVER